MRIAAALLIMTLAVGCGGSSGSDDLSCGDKVTIMADDHFDRTGEAPSDSLYDSYRQAAGCED